MQEILLVSAILLSLNRAWPLALGRTQVEEHCYRYVLGHLATNTLQHNKFEAEHAKIIFFEILWTILELTAYDCFLGASPLFTSAPPSSNRLMFWGSLTHFAPERKRCYCLLYCLRPNTLYAKG